MMLTSAMISPHLCCTNVYSRPRVQLHEAGEEAQRSLPALAAPKVVHHREQHQVHVLSGAAQALKVYMHITRSMLM